MKSIITKTLITTFSSLSVFNLYYNSGTDTTMTGPIWDFRETIFNSRFLKINGKVYEIGSCYIKGRKTKERDIGGFQTEPQLIKNQVFNTPGIIKFRYLGFYVPFYDRTFRHIYHINVLQN